MGQMLGKVAQSICGNKDSEGFPLNSAGFYGEGGRV